MADEETNRMASDKSRLELIDVLTAQGLTLLEASEILYIAEEYSKPNHGKWEWDT